jgi:isopenicillin N synthase-like dioxygenase
MREAEERSMNDLAPSLNPIRADAPEEIPVIDLGPYLAGAPGARETAAAALRHAFEEVGFYFIVNHGVPQSLVDDAFAAARRFHDQKLDEKLKLKINHHNIGYLPVRGSITRHSRINEGNKPNVNEAFFAKRDLPSDHPDVVAALPFRGANQWPADLPGFRATVLAYQAALEKLALSLLPLYALALDLPADWFTAKFREPMYTLRMSHYPKVDKVAENEFGLAPHTDTSFMTLLAQNRVPGLSIRLPNGNWVDAPALDGSFLVNGGDMLRRWTNERFLATPHRVINRSGQERYAIPFFFDCDYRTVMECIPTCTGSDNPPKYPPMGYPEYMTWYRSLNYGGQDGAKGSDGVKLSAG